MKACIFMALAAVLILSSARTPFASGMPDVYERLNSGRFMQALALIDEVIEADPGDPEPYRVKYRALRGMGRNIEAVDALNAGISAAVPDAELYSLRASVMLSAGLWESALGDADKAANLNPGSAKIHMVRARALERLGRIPEMLRASARAVSIGPSDPEARLYYSRAHYLLGGYGEALVQVQRAVDLDGMRPELLYFKGMVLVQLKRHEEAEEAFGVALSMSPGVAEIKYRRAYNLSVMGRPAEGVMLMRECVDAAPENESYRLGLAFALLHTDGRDEAAEAGNLIGAVLGTTRHPLTKARAQAMLGDREGLVRTLSRMKEDGNMAGLVMVGRLAEFEPYLADPEFNAVLED